MVINFVMIAIMLVISSLKVENMDVKLHACTYS